MTTPDGGGAAAACAVASAAASSASMAARVPTAATPSSGASRCTRDAKKLLNALIVGMVAAFAVKSVPTFDGRSHRYKCLKDWVDDSLCAASPPRLSESKNRGRALLGNCAKRPKSSDSVSCNGHGWCHEGTTASGNKPHCNCDAGYGGSHCETKILNLEELSIKVADIDEELEKKAESVDQG